MSRKPVWARLVWTEKGSLFCCRVRHAEASARCYVKLYNKWARALWTGWPHRPGRVTTSPTCGSNKMAPPSARHVGDTAFQWNSLKLKNKSNKHCPGLTGRPWNRPQRKGRSVLIPFIYLRLKSLFIYLLFEPHNAENGEKMLIILNSVCSSPH